MEGYPTMCSCCGAINPNTIEIVEYDYSEYWGHSMSDRYRVTVTECCESEVERMDAYPGRRVGRTRDKWVAARDPFGHKFTHDVKK